MVFPKGLSLEPHRSAARMEGVIRANAAYTNFNVFSQSARRAMDTAVWL
jgi:hypothetical protein